MKVQRSFTVPAPAATVLAGLTDVGKIAECLPGGLIDGRERGGRFGGSFALQLGTATAPYTAIIAVPQRDDAAGYAVVSVSGHDDQGDGTVEVTATFALREESGVTAVDLELDVELGGRLSRVPDVEATAESYARTSVAALRSSVAAPAAPPPPPPEAAVSEEPIVPVMPPTPPPVEPPHPPEPDPPAAAVEPQPTAPPAPQPPAPAAPAPPPPAPKPPAPPAREPEPPAPEPPASGPPAPPPPAPEPPTPPAPAPEPPAPPAPAPPPPEPEPPAPPAPAPEPPVPAPEPEPEPPAPRTESIAPPGYQRQGTAPASRKPKASRGGGGGLLGRLRGLLKRGR